MSDLEAEIAACRAAYVGAAVTEIALLRGAAHGVRWLRGRDGRLPPPLRVRYQECDPQGVVYFARYPEYYDLALTELFREVIGSYQSMVEAARTWWSPSRASAIARARFDELIDVDVPIDKLGTRRC